MIGSFELKAKLVTFGFLTGFFSAKLYAFSTQIVNLDFFKSCTSEHYEEYGAQVASIAIIIISKPKLNPRFLLSNQQKQIRKLLDDNGST